MLILYPIKIIRKCLSKCKLDSLSLNLFTEKFYSCYRDGLDGGRDMRSFAGFYFLLRFLPFLYYGFRLKCTFLTLWTYCVLLFLASVIIITLVKPYKATYMNVLDSLLLGLLAFICAVLSENTNKLNGNVTQAFIAVCLPSFAFVLILLSGLVIKFYKWLSNMFKAKTLGGKCSAMCDQDDHLQPLLTDRNTH